MQVRSVITAMASLCASVAPLAQAPQSVAQPSFEQLAAECAPDIHPSTLKAVVRTESSGNPYAIGVVGGQLERQPRSLAEAAATARELERQGFNFSMGLGQINRHNLAKHGETYDTVFEPCRNLKAGGAILKDCFLRARRTMSDDQNALRAAFSCYYSGNFTRGFRPDNAGQPSYVQKVAANASEQVPAIPVVPAIQPQRSDSPVALRAANTSATPSKPAEVPSRWVIHADNSGQDEPSNVHTKDDAAMEPVVKVRLASPPSGQAPSGSMEQATMQRKARTRSEQPVTQDSDQQQELPFVQFVN